MDVIEIKHLSKSFKDVKAVNDLSFKVKEGELFAFLGVNGAGKSTTISVICGQIKKDSGEVFINGKNVSDDSSDFKNILGIVFQGCVLDQFLTVYDNLKTRASLYGITCAEFESRLKELSELLELDELLNRPVGKLSGGQRRRIDIARALFHRPKILILDEPTTGLDPQTRTTIWRVIDTLRRNEKMTVLLTTHYMEEASEADYVVIIDNGAISAEGTPLELKNRYTGDYIMLYNVDEEKVKSLGYPYEKLRDAYKIAVPDTAAATSLIVKNARLFSDYEITKGKMDDVFLAVTGKKLEGGKNENA